MQPTYRFPEAIVSTDWLAAHLDDPKVRIFECTTYLTPPTPGVDAPYTVTSGRADYDAGHIPGAAFVDLQNELSDDVVSHLRFTLPPLDELARRFAAVGVNAGHKVVLYSRASMNWATRVWWMLRAVGFDDAAVLDGGFDKWSLEARPTSTEPRRHPAGQFTARPRPGLFVGRAAVHDAIGDAGICTINALTPDLHRGENPRYGRPGRIPGSVNLPAADLVDPKDKSFVTADVAARHLGAVGAAPGKCHIVYCGGGIAATLDAFLMHQLGFENIAVYDDSMSEWARDESLPIETG
ncbi:MAG: sulfurtransferase [Ectothiorhodospiraceae bacterium]|nr:sulfurtransferase [Chromatiales bacterium]MCP5154158.1 sulfurtransferase [Ectothiorhodospiraceae bacterium]